eukprot:3136850-Lingulodinium_polyedra.AAC.1
MSHCYSRMASNSNVWPLRASITRAMNPGLDSKGRCGEDHKHLRASKKPGVVHPTNGVLFLSPTSFRPGVMKGWWRRYL